MRYQHSQRWLAICKSVTNGFDGDWTADSNSSRCALIGTVNKAQNMSVRKYSTLSICNEMPGSGARLKHKQVMLCKKILEWLLYNISNVILWKTCIISNYKNNFRLVERVNETIHQPDNATWKLD